MHGLNDAIPKTENDAVNQPSNLQTHFVFTTKDLKTYNLILIMKSKLIEIKVRRVMGRDNYEGIFSYNDLTDICDVFYMFPTLENAHKDLVQKMIEKKLDIEEYEDILNLEFTFNVGWVIKVKLKLKKGNEENISQQVDDICNYVLSNSETIKQFQDEKIEKAQSFAMSKLLNLALLILTIFNLALIIPLQHTVSAQDKKLEKLEVIFSARGIELEKQEEIIFAQGKGLEKLQGIISTLDKKYQEIISALEKKLEKLLKIISAQNKKLEKQEQSISDQDKKLKKEEGEIIISQENLKNIKDYPVEILKNF